MTFWITGDSIHNGTDVEYGNSQQITKLASFHPFSKLPDSSFATPFWQSLAESKTKMVQVCIADHFLFKAKMFFFFQYRVSSNLLFSSCFQLDLWWGRDLFGFVWTWFTVDAYISSDLRITFYSTSIINVCRTLNSRSTVNCCMNLSRSVSADCFVLDWCQCLIFLLSAQNCWTRIWCSLHFGR